MQFPGPSPGPYSSCQLWGPGTYYVETVVIYKTALSHFILTKSLWGAYFIIIPILQVRELN